MIRGLTSRYHPVRPAFCPDLPTGTRPARFRLRQAVPGGVTRVRFARAEIAATFQVRAPAGGTIMRA